MNDKLPELQKGQQGPNAQDPSRRRLLRAAAAAAPLIATLPSGAALANSSAYQCVVKTEEASEGFGDAPVLGGDYLNGTASGPPTPDQWYRVAAFRAQWTQPSPATGSVVLYRFTGSDATTGPWYTELTGLVFDPAAQSPAYLKGAETNVLVLRLYKPSPNGTAPMGVSSNCDRTTPVPAGIPEDGCVFPYARRDLLNDKDGNMGMNGSCMCSINPNYPGCPGAGGP